MNKEYIHKDTRTDEPLQTQIETLTRWQDPTIKEYKKEIERLNNIIKNKDKIIKAAIRKLKAAAKHYALEGKNNAINHTLNILKEGK